MTILKALKSRKAMLILFPVLFISLLIVVGILLQQRIRTMFHTYVEQEVAMDIDMLANRLDARFGAELMGMENLIRVKGTDSWESLLAADDAEGMGIKRMGVLAHRGRAIVGDSLKVSEWDGIRQSFQGYPAISYAHGKGLLLTVPIYYGANIRYVLYRHYTEEELAKEFDIDCFDGAGRVMLVLSGGSVPMSSGEWSEADHSYIGRMERGGILRQLRAKLYNAPSAALYDQNENVVFMADMKRMDGQVIGFVPASALDGGLIAVMRLVIWVFSMLVLLFIVGTAYLFTRERRVMESDQASRAKSTFLAHMSHEIRTPLNAIIGMNEMILRETQEKNVRIYANRAHEAGQALLGIVNDILDLSKIEAGKMDFIEADFRLTEVLQRVYTLMQLRAAKKDLALLIKVDPTLPTVLYSDATRLQQIMVNLLTNAIKYTPQGSVTLSVRRCAPGNVPEQVTVPADHPIVLIVEVRDTGIGIKPEDVKRLFGEFVRVDTRRNRNIEGTGLGLALTQRFIQRMGGIITVRSTYGEGSTFTAWLPMCQHTEEQIGEFDVQKAVAVAEVQHTPIVAPDAHILVVDDNEMNRFVAQSLLKETQARVKLADSGRACLDCLRQAHYDLILLDDMMPELSGTETLAVIRREHLAEGTPIVVLTANAINGAREKYLAQGFDDYLAKPIKMEELTVLLRRQLPQAVQAVPEAAPAPAEPAAQAAGVEELPAEPAAETVTPAEPAAETASPVAADAEPTAAESGIDTALGLMYAGGSDELRRTMLQMFVQMQPEKAAKIAAAYAAADWQNYAIEVHALKSTSLSIGGRTLSAQAKALEMAAKAARDAATPENEREAALAELHAGHEPLLSAYAALAGEARRLLTE